MGDLEIFIFLIYGDYVSVHSVVIPLAMLTYVVYFSVCELYFTVKKKNFKSSKKKVRSFGKFRGPLES